MSNAAKLKKRAAEYEQKKQYDKALALYVQVLQKADGAEDDADVPLFNRVGDLLLRLGNVNEALTYFEKAIDLYAERGFLNNAIALCNRVLRQSPSRTSVYYKLGRISAAKGFKSDAKKNFLEYADRMQRSGELDEAFRALKEFADLCPDQDDIRLMLAEQLSKEGRKDEALQQLQLLHTRLEDEGRVTEARATVDRMKAIDPEFVPVARSGPARRAGGDLVFLDLGDNGSRDGAPTATRQVSDPDMVAYQTSSRASAARAADLPAESADDLRLILPEDLGPPSAIEPLDLVATAIEADAPGAMAIDGLSSLIDLEPTSLDDESERDSVIEPMEFEPTSMGASADASEDAPVIEFEALGELEADPVTPAETPSAPSQDHTDAPAGDNAYSSGGAESLSFDDELLHLDGRPMGESAPNLEQSTSLDPDVSFPLDDFSDVPASSSAATDAPPEDTGAFPQFNDSNDDEASDLDVYESGEPSTESHEDPAALDDDTELLEGSAAASTADEEHVELDDFDASATDDELDGELDGEVSVDELAEAAAALVTPSASPRVDEAQLTELEARVHASPGDWSLRRTWAEALLESGDRDAGLAELETAMTGLELEGHLDEASTLMEELLALTPSNVRLHQRRVEFAVRSGDRGQLVRAYVQLADALFRSGEVEKAGVVYQRVVELAPDNEQARDGLNAAGLMDEAPAPHPEPVKPAVIPEMHWSTPVATPAAGNDAPSGDDFVDLGDLLRAEAAPRSTRMVTAEEAPSGDEQADFDEMLRRFKQGVSDNVDEEDFESHYDLGVAYKEMGLVDEAIAEFQKSLRGPALRLRACEALGSCFVEKERYQVATSILRRALALGDADDHQLIGVLYLLGQACEALGRSSDALGFYQRVFAVDIEFRDVADRIAVLDRIPTT